MSSQILSCRGIGLAAVGAAASRAVGEGRDRSLAARRLCRARSRSGARSPRSGDADAAFNLGQAYRLGRGVPTNLARGPELVRARRAPGPRRCADDARPAAVPERRPGRGPEWLKQAAEQGEPRALLVYGTALFNGDGVTQDPILGYAYVSRAAAQGLAPAKETLAQLDQLMPLDRPQKGVALAHGQGRSQRRRRSRQGAERASRPAAAEASAGQGRRRSAAKPLAADAAPTPPATRRLADPARRLLAARLGRGAVSASVSGKAALAGRQPLLCRRPARSPGCRSGRSPAEAAAPLRRAARSAGRLLPGRRRNS